MGQKDAMSTLRSKIRYGLDTLYHYSNQSYPDPVKYLRLGRLVIALKKPTFSLSDVTELADIYFVEYPFLELAEGSEDWDVVLAMLEFCSDDCLKQTLLQDRKADLPTEITDYILNLLKK